MRDEETQHWLTQAAFFEEKLTASEKRVAILGDHVCELQSALRDLVMLERVSAPDMSSKPRTYALMQNGAVLAEALDRARSVLGKTI